MDQLQNNRCCLLQHQAVVLGWKNGLANVLSGSSISLESIYIIVSQPSDGCGGTCFHDSQTPTRHNLGWDFFGWKIHYSLAKEIFDNLWGFFSNEDWVLLFPVGTSQGSDCPCEGICLLVPGTSQPDQGRLHPRLSEWNRRFLTNMQLLERKLNP